MSAEKIQVLKDTLDGLNGRKKYEWANHGQCNCGMLAQTITGRTGSSIENAFDKSEVGSWTTNIEAFKDQNSTNCSTTGRPVAEIIKKMFDKGFTVQELIDLEWLRNPEILIRAKQLGNWEVQDESAYRNKEEKKDNYKYESRTNLKLYLQAWLQILEEKEAKKLAKKPKVEQSISNDLKHAETTTNKTLTHEH